MEAVGGNFIIEEAFMTKEKSDGGIIEAVSR